MNKSDVKQLPRILALSFACMIDDPTKLGLFPSIKSMRVHPRAAA